MVQSTVYSLRRLWLDVRCTCVQPKHPYKRWTRERSVWSGRELYLLRVKQERGRLQGINTGHLTDWRKAVWGMGTRWLMGSGCSGRRLTPDAYSTSRVAVMIPIPTNDGEASGWRVQGPGLSWQRKKRRPMKRQRWARWRAVWSNAAFPINVYGFYGSQNVCVILKLTIKAKIPEHLCLPPERPHAGEHHQAPETEPRTFCTRQDSAN